MSPDEEEEGPAPTTTLVLSAGGMRGLAHVGAWRALTEAGIRIDHVVGSSIGALVGAAIATGIDPDELEERARKVSRRDVAVPWRWPWWARGTPRPGLLRGDVLRDFVESLLPPDPDRRLSIPLDVATVDLESGELAWFAFRPADGGVRCLPPFGGNGTHPDSPGIVDAVLASTAIPVFFPPVRIGERSFVDGGVLAPLPLRRAARTKARRVFAVDVRTSDEEEAVPFHGRGLLGVSLRTLSIATCSPSASNARAPDGIEVHRIRPEVDGVGCLDFSCNDRLLQEGYRAGRRALGTVASAREPDPAVPLEIR